jgi:hypothetical protein
LCSSDTPQFLSYPTTTACLLTVQNPVSPSYGQLCIPFIKQPSNCVKVQSLAHWDWNITYRYPIMEIWQIYLAIMVDKHRRFDLHIGRRFHVTHWGIVRMCIHQPDTYGNIVYTTCRKHRSWLGSPDKTRVVLHLTTRSL